MKKTLVTIFLVLTLGLINISLSQESNKKPIFSRILEYENIDSYRLPTFLIKYVLSFDEENDEIKSLFNGSRFVNFAIHEDMPNDYSRIVNNIVKRLDESSYSTLVEITEKRSKVTIKALYDDDVIREIVVLVCDNNEFVALSMTGRMDKDEIVRSITKLSKKRTI